MNGNASTSSYIAESIDLLHGRLGHVNYASTKRLKNLKLIFAVNVDNASKCFVCVAAKYAKRPFKSVNSRQTILLKLVYSDLASFKNTAIKGGKMFYVTFVNDYLRCTKVYLIRFKNEAKEIFLKYKAEVENQLDRKIKRLRTDRGEEYEN